MPSSNASSPCRFEWRPSRWPVAVSLALAAFAPFSVWVSEMPRVFAWPLMIAACAAGLVLARREARLPRLRVAIEAPDRVAIDDTPVREFRVEWRGPLAFLSWRDGEGRRQRRSLWPDTLPPPLRRELRLAMPESDAVRGRDTMAP